jgi:hypothetical protein
VSHLGGIYERLLEYTLQHEVAGRRQLRTQGNQSHRCAAGQLCTQGIGQLLHPRRSGASDAARIGGPAGEGAHADFALPVSTGSRKSQSLNPGDWDGLDKLDPASAILELHVCDPAMGSGHFLVALVDDLADRVLEAINTAEHLVSEQPWAAHLVEQKRPWQSPLVARIAAIRATIRREAGAHGWAVTDAQLDDRHVVRRMILKKSVFGVDKNPMAVELAKTALWLHTFTVGAPLSFLDHHLKCGDSLHGERLPT